MKKWSIDKIILEINKLYNSNIPLNDKYIRKHYPLLRAAACKYFKNWRNAVIASGIEDQSIRMKWDKNSVVNTILILDKTGYDLSSSNIKKYKSGLYKAAKRYFGSWENIIRRVLNKEICKHIKWTSQQVIEQIHKNYSKGALSYTDVDSSLYKAAKRYFGTWKSALEASGIPYDCGRKTLSWSKDKIIKRIKDHHGDLSCNALILDGYYGLVAAGQRHFGRWANAVNSAGLDYSQFIKRNCFGYPGYGKDGILYDSVIERKCADFLLSCIDKKLINIYIPHKKICNNRKWKCDFYVETQSKNLWIEVDGFGNNRPNSLLFKEKINYYITSNINYKIVYSLNELKEVINCLEK